MAPELQLGGIGYYACLYLKLFTIHDALNCITVFLLAFL
jgi:hypothetical protein